MKSPNPLVNLSTPEFERFLDAYKGFKSKDFRKLVGYMKEPELSYERYMDEPQVLIEMDGRKVKAEYNQKVRDRVHAKISGLDADELPEYTLEGREWVEKKQKEIVNYLAHKQRRFLESGNPFDMVEMTQEGLGSRFGLHYSSVGRLMKHLTVKLPKKPKGKAAFAELLVPGSKLTHHRGVYALRMLKKNPAFYRRGEWLASDEELSAVIERDFGLEIARRTVNKYRNMMEKEPEWS